MDLFLQRLHSQRLAGPRLGSPEDVVRWLGAVQAQDYAGAKWSLGQRLRQGTDAAIDRALAEGRILRTHVLRPTWHFVVPDDIRWLLRLTGPRVLAQCAYQYPALELDRGLFRRAHAVFERALRDGSQLTRAELGAALRRAGIAAAGQRLAYIAAEAELVGLICSGGLRGKQHTYSLLEERVPTARLPDRDEALAELARCFFTGHGPATLRHYAWWAGLTVADARRGIAEVESELARVERDGRTYWLRLTTAAPRRRRPMAYLLPEFDEAFLGYKDPPLPDLPRAGGKPRWRSAWPRPVIVGGGRAGTWRRTISRGKVVVEMDLFSALDPVQRGALAEAAGRYGRFLGLPVRLSGRRT